MSKRDEFVETLKANLDKWNAEIDGWEAKAIKLDAQSRARLRALKQEIVGKIQLAEQKLTIIKNSETIPWGDLKAGAERAWKDVEDGLKQAREKWGG